MKFAILATIVAGAVAEDFYWNKNSNFYQSSNWAVEGTACDDTAAGGCPTKDSNGGMQFDGPLIIPEATDCADNQWTGAEGHVIKMDSSATVGLLQLPMNGKIMLGEDVVMTFDEDIETATETSWKCKPIAETNWKCGANWNLGGFGEDAKVAHRVPCSADTVVFPDDSSSYEVNVPQNTFISSLRLENPGDFDVESAFVAEGGMYTLGDQAEVNRFFDVYSNQFQGGVPSTGDECGSEADCAGFCSNHCASLEGENAEEQRVSLQEAMQQKADRAAAHQADVESKKTSDAVLEKIVALGEAKNIVTNLNQLEADFEAKFAGSFPADRRNRRTEGTGSGDGTISAEEITTIFAKDLREHMAVLGSTLGFSPKGSDSYCVATSSGGISCPGISQFTTQYGKVRDTTAQIWKFLTAYFDQANTDTAGILIDEATYGVILNENDGGVSKFQSGGDAKSITINFGFSDADFCVSRFGAGVFPRAADGSASGYLSPNDCQVIEDSLDIGYAQTILSEMSLIDAADLLKMREDMTDETKLTSTLAIGSADPIDITGVVAKDGTKTHAFDSGRFKAEIEASNLSPHFDEQSYRAALAVAMWHAVAKDVAPAYALKESNKYSTTTTTTVSTTTVSTTTTTIFFNVTAFLEDPEEARKLAAKSTADVQGEVIAAQEALDELLVALAEARALLDTNPDSEALKDAFKALKVKVNAADAAKVLVEGQLDAKQTANAEAAEGEEPAELPWMLIAIGVAVLGVLGVIVAKTSGGGGGGGGSSHDGGRNDGAAVVAFENPMYDDPAQSADRFEAAPEEEDDGGGLYDEPAFDAGDGNDTAGAAGGGYLDVEPEEEEEEEEEEEAAAEEEEEESEEEESEEDESEDDE
jgi:hypothetical protein